MLFCFALAKIFAGIIDLPAGGSGVFAALTPTGPGFPVDASAARSVSGTVIVGFAAI
jgi:hypothetical protein